MRTTKTMTISLPPEFIRQFEAVRKAESRTSSELVREALRQYFENRYPLVQPTKAEIKAIKQGRDAYNRGDFQSLNDFLNDVDSKYNKQGKKGPATNSRKRPKAH
jgi:predicted transcriptional regulator